MRIFLIFSFFLLMGVGLKAQKIYRVNTVEDIDDGVCDNRHCTLREAINASNSDGLKNIIWFEITGPGKKVINLDTELPAIKENNLIIEGTTLPNNYPTQGRLIIDGQNKFNNGLSIQSSDIIIYGLQIQNFIGSAIHIQNSEKDTISRVTVGGRKQGNIFIKNGNAVYAENINRLVFKANYVGTNFDFEPNLGNKNGVIIENNWNSYENADLFIGGSINLEENNYFANCSETALDLTYHGSAKIEGNIFGTGINGDENLGNKVAIKVSNRRGRIDIGGSEDTKNIFAYNENAVIVDRDNFVRVSENSFYCNNSGLIIIENAHPIPVITSGVETIITGTAQANDFVEVYISDTQTPCKNGDCQGMNYLGTIRANGGGDWQFPGNFLFGQQLVALARNNGRQSMFSDCFRVCPSSIRPKATNSGPYCENDTIRLDANSDIYGFQWVTPFYGQEIIYEWTGPNGYYSEEENPNNAIEPGNYILQAYFYGCPSLLDTTTVAVTHLKVEIPEIPAHCQADSIMLNGLVTGNMSDFSYQWTGPNGFTSTVHNPLDAKETGTYNLVVSGGGCQSEMLGVEVINLFPEPFSLGEATSICPGESISLSIENYDFYHWEGDFDLACDTCSFIEFTPSQDGNIQLSAGPNEVCNTTSSLIITVEEEINTSEELTLCPGSTISLSNLIINSSGTYPMTFTGNNGCDSTHTYFVNQVEPVNVLAVRSICEGEVLVENGQSYATSGIFESHYTGANGCDSTYILDLTVLSKTIKNEVFSICAGESFLVFDTLVASSYAQTRTFTSANGCDSIHSISVTVKETFQETKNISLCAGDFITILDDLVVAESGVYQKNYVANNGCDSIVNVVIDVLAPVHTYASIIMCDKDAIVMQETTNTYPSDYTETLSAQSGCDSFHHVSYTVLTSQEIEEVITICETESYILNGQAINTSGRYSNNYTGRNGCDSTHIINLTILKTDYQEEVSELCQGESINIFGNIVQEAGIYTQTFANQNGCDSSHTITLLVNQSQSTSERLTICEGASITVYDQLISENRQVTKTFSGASGCDSVHTIEIEVLETSFSEENIQVCSATCIDIYGATVCANQSLAKTFIGTNGCDSIHTLRLEIMEEKNDESYLEICAAACMDIYGVTACSDRKLVNTFTASSGCDSIHTLHFTLMDAKETIEEFTLCEGDSISIFGRFIKESGEFTNLFSANNGCDSLHKTIVHISTPIKAEITVQPTCENQTNGKMEVAINGGSAPYALIWEGKNMEGMREMDELPEGIYEVVIQDKFNCQIQKSFLIEELPLPIVEKEIVEISCFGANDGSIALFSNEQLTYSLNGQNRVEGEFSNLASGTYELQVKSEMGCEIKEHIFLLEPEKVVVELPERLTINLGNSIELIPQTSGAEIISYEWLASETLSCLDCETTIATPLINTKYQLTVYNENNCESTDEVLVLVETNKGIYTANVFSPNNDGHNDNFTIQSVDGPIEEVATFKVFDRWGNLVYEANNFQPNNEYYGWDGRYKGQAMNNGVYIYFAIIKFIDGTETKVQGDITLAK